MIKILFITFLLSCAAQHNPPPVSPVIVNDTIIKRVIIYDTLKRDTVIYRTIYIPVYLPKYLQQRIKTGDIKYTITVK